MWPAARAGTWRRRAAACCLAACGPLAALAQDSATPVQLRRIGLGQPAGMKDPIGASVEACRAARQLPPGPVVLPPDAALARLVVHEEEEFFDGGRWASYVTQRSLRADPSHRDCQLAVFVHRRVVIEQTCDSRLQGATPPIAELSDPTQPRPPTFELKRSAASRAGCGRKAKDEDVAGLPVQDANGTPCVWSSDLQARMMRQAGLKAQGHDDNGAFDTCVYLRQPSHVYQGHRRKIVLKTRGADRTLGGADLGQIIGEAPAYSHQQLASFSAGAPVPAGRFTEALAEAFLKRPAKTALGDGT